MAEPQRVTMYVDGFNLYHGLVERQATKGYRWLNLWRLGEHLLLQQHRLERVVFFTSVPPWDPGKAQRHRTYIAALKSAGVEVVEGRFQVDEKRCRARCREAFPYHVEKLTDVNIASTMLADAVEGRFDWAYLLTGDADQSPAVRALRRVAPKAKVHVIFPPRRHSAELQKLADRYYGEIGWAKLRDSQFPDQITTPGRIIQKPKTW